MGMKPSSPRSLMQISRPFSINTAMCYYLQSLFLTFSSSYETRQMCCINGRTLRKIRCMQIRLAARARDLWHQMAKWSLPWGAHFVMHCFWCKILHSAGYKQIHSGPCMSWIFVQHSCITYQKLQRLNSFIPAQNMIHKSQMIDMWFIMYILFWENQQSEAYLFTWERVNKNPHSTCREIAFFFFGTVYCLAANVKVEGGQGSRIPTFGDDVHGVYFCLCVGKIVVSLCGQICWCFDEI